MMQDNVSESELKKDENDEADSYERLGNDKMHSKIGRACLSN